MESRLHSVTLDIDKCVGCTDCIKRCPTEAIRVRNSKAVINDERCIDCGMCIRVCNHGAKKAVTDSFDMIKHFKYKVAIPAPTLYSQFHHVIDPNVVLTGLKNLGFDDVIEVAKGADYVSEFTRKYMKIPGVQLPIISSACPAIVRLIQIRFPSLIPNIMPVISPMEATARYIRKYLVDKGMKKEDIGIFFISPCAAKVTDSIHNEMLDETNVDGTISMKDIYVKLHNAIRQVKEPEQLLTSTYKGIAWAETGGEGQGIDNPNYLAVDGIDNVIKILELIEDESISVDFVECLACTNGCIGGPLTIEDSFVSKYQMTKILNYADKHSKKRDIDIYDENINLFWDNKLQTHPVMKLDKDMEKALDKMERLEKIFDTLPQIDCGSCGAPTCRALAEDIVREKANIEDCIFMLRNKVRIMAQEMVGLAQKMPPSISSTIKENEA